MGKKVFVIGGSNSKNSINKKFAVAAANKLVSAEAVVIDLNDYVMPLYGIDEETDNGIALKATELFQEFQSADGFILSLAEHNGSYSVAFKNMLDWLSRIEGNMWLEKPMLLLSTSPGGRGGISVLEAGKTRFPRMGAKITGSMALPSFFDNYSDDQGITNEDLDDLLTDLVEAFEKQL